MTGARKIKKRRQRLLLLLLYILTIIIIIITYDSLLLYVAARSDHIRNSLFLGGYRAGNRVYIYTSYRYRFSRRCTRYIPSYLCNRYLHAYTYHALFLPTYPPLPTTRHCIAVRRRAFHPPQPSVLPAGVETKGAFKTCWDTEPSTRVRQSTCAQYIIVTL